MRIIKCNKAKCKRCGGIVESKTRWDFQKCPCGTIFVDGGKSYLRRGAINLQQDIEELSEYEEDGK